MKHKKLNIFMFALIIFFVFVNLHIATVHDIGHYPIQRSVTFNPYIRTDYRKKISDEQPEIIILGDSAIRQLNEEKISDVTDRNTLVFSMPGTGSAYWYLFIRNQLFLADHWPDYFILFFRDSTLTMPEYRVNGEYLIRLEEIASSWDEDVYELAINGRKSAMVRFFESYIPLFAYRSEDYFNIIQWFRNTLPEKILKADKQMVDTAYKAVFGREQVNDLLWEELLLNKDNLLYLPESLDLTGCVNHSFLPAMLRDLKKMGIQPIFIRVRYRSHAMGEIDQDDLVLYLTELTEYIENAGGIFLDLSSLEGLSAEMYEDNFHIFSVYGGQATVIIAQELAYLLK